MRPKRSLRNFILVMQSKVTGALLLRCNEHVQTIVYNRMNTETTTSIRMRIARFFSDRYAYRAQPNYLSELVAFGIILLMAIWPVILLANAMAAVPR
jgi:hypothetical protein